MSLILAPVTDRRERILVYGSPGVGKSYAWQTILSHSPDTVRFHVLDTDGAWEPAAASDEFAEHAHRVTHHEPETWPEYIEAMKQSRKEMLESAVPTETGGRRTDDWLVIDLGDKAWAAAQDYYADRKYSADSDSEDFFAALVDGDLGNDEDNMAKWGVINKLYAPFQTAIIRCPGNVFICATAKELKKDSRGNYFRETRDNVRDYGGVGSRPGGQKALGHDVNTVLYFEGTQAGRRTFTRIKDRNREGAWGEDLQRSNLNFPKSFLLPVAGWRPVTGE